MISRRSFILGGVATAIGANTIGITALAAPLQPLTPITQRKQIVELLSNHLQQMCNQRKIYDYLVICDDTNNPPSVVIDNRVNIDILVKPSHNVEMLHIRHNCPSGTDGNELIPSLNRLPFSKVNI